MPVRICGWLQSALLLAGTVINLLYAFGSVPREAYIAVMLIALIYSVIFSVFAYTVKRLAKYRGEKPSSSSTTTRVEAVISSTAITSWAFSLLLSIIL